MKAFVTGGTGFIGANLIRHLLDRGHHVRALARPQSNLANLCAQACNNLEIVLGDLSDPAQLTPQLQGCDVLFHVAAHYSLWRADRDSLQQANVIGTRNILQAARQAQVSRTVYTSSVAAIGLNPNGQPTTETYQSPPEKLIGYYKQSKYWAEQEAHQAVRSGQDIVIVNPTTPIGAWDIKPTPTGEIIQRVLQRRMPVYVNTGLNLIAVDDVCIGHLCALERGQVGERYILGHANLTLKALLDRLAALTNIPAPTRSIPHWIPQAVAYLDEGLLTQLGKTPSVSIDSVRMSRQYMYYDASKAVTELGLPQSSIDDALKAAVQWMLDAGMAD